VRIEAADPYPWPYDGDLDPRRLALVVAGAQAAFAGRSVGAGAVARTLAAVAAAVARAGGLVVHLRHASATRRPSGLPPPPGGAGWALATHPAPGDLVVDAAGLDGFFGSGLDAALRARGADTLVLAGFGAEAAVSSTLRGANDRGYECLTLADAAAPFDPATGARSLHTVTMSGGIFGAVAPAAALLAALPDPVPVEVLP